jgi:hypothetical protein
MSRRKWILAAVALLLPAAAFAHLCNDVFRQAQDNLAVKVDIRDGQLRIGQQASFRVYLLNTMDREITAISLDVLSDHFDAQIRPSAEWRDYPRLRATGGGGKKEFFTVALQRKQGVPDGRYKIDLHLYNPQNKQQVFKTIDLASAAAACALPPSRGIAVDGGGSEAEWGNSCLATDFYLYTKQNGFFGNKRVESQARFRIAMDEQSLYCLMQFMGGEQATSDVGTVHVATDPEGKPMQFNFDRISGRLSSDQPTEGIAYVVSPDRTMIECRIPRALLQPAGAGQPAPGYFVNFTRTATVNGQQFVTYWRGNTHSVNDPIVYGYFTLAEQPQAAG